MVPKTRVFHAADGEDLVILACTVSDWSTRVMDEQTDRQTELQWLRCTTAVTAVARKNRYCWSITNSPHICFYCGWH